MVNIAFQKLYCLSKFTYPNCLKFHDNTYSLQKNPSITEVKDALALLLPTSLSDSNLTKLLVSYLNLLSAYPEIESLIGKDWANKTYDTTHLTVSVNFKDILKNGKALVVDRLNQIKDKPQILFCLKRAGLELKYLNCDDIYKKMAYVLVSVILCNDIEVF